MDSLRNDDDCRTLGNNRQLANPFATLANIQTMIHPALIDTYMLEDLIMAPSYAING